MPTKIAYGAALDTVFDTMAFTRSCLKADKYALALVPQLEYFIPKYLQVLQTELGFREAIMAATALIRSRDNDLNDVSELVIKAILVLAKNGFKDPLYQLYCGDKRPYDFLSPILGEQLESVRKWSNLLRNAATDASLRALADLVDLTVKAADDAMGVSNKADTDNKAFRQLGDRKAFIDWCNERREQLFADLKEIRKNSGGKLSEDWPNEFFPKSRARNSVEARVDIQSLSATIAAKEQELTALKAQLADLQKQEEERTQVETTLANAMATLAESQRAADEAQQRADELRARLGR